MLHTFSSHNFHTLCDEISSGDTDLSDIIRVYGYPPMWNRPNTFETLLHIILEQQVSLPSALATLNKLREKIVDITPERLLSLTDEELRACYFSRQKTAYARHLAGQLIDSRIDLHSMTSLPDEEIRAKLVALKGIGNWTVDIYLIF